VWSAAPLARPCYRLLAEPDRQRAALAQASLVGLPVRHLVAGLRNPMATVGIVFVRPGQTRRSGRGRFPTESSPHRQPRHPCTTYGRPPPCKSFLQHADVESRLLPSIRPVVQPGGWWP
jgi:hypothetical protein